MSETWEEFRVLYEFNYGVGGFYPEGGWHEGPIDPIGSRSTEESFLEGVQNMVNGGAGRYRNVRVEKRTVTATGWDEVE